MKSRHRLSVCIVVVFAITAGACGAPYTSFFHPQFNTGVRKFDYKETAHSFRLPNGLNVLLLPDSNTNLVQVDVRYRVGAAEDPGDKSGLAHLVEHLMFQVRGKGINAAKLGERLTSVTLSHNAYTIWDETHYTATALKRNLNALLELEAERLATTCGQLDDASLASEKDVVRSEIRQRASVGQTIGQLIRRKIYGQNHAYTRSIGGSLRQVASVTRNDVCDFIRNYHSPQRTILVVAGNFERAATIELITRTLGAVAPRRAAPRVRIRGANARPGGTRVEMAVEQATVFFVSRAPVFVDAAAESHLALRWFFELNINAKVAKLDYVTNVTISRMGGIRAPLLVAAITVNDLSKISAIEKLFFATRHELGKDLSDGMVAALMARRAASLLAGIERLSGRAGWFADYLQYSGGRLTPKKMIRKVWLTDRRRLVFSSAPFFERSSTYIVRVSPKPKGKKAQRRSVRAVVQTSDKTYDVRDWSQAVDLNTLDKDLPMPTTRIRRPVKSFILKNGLRVLLVPSMAYPLVDVRMVFPVGALRDSTMPAVSRLAATLLDIDTSKRVHHYHVDTLNWVMENGGTMDRKVSWRATTFRVSGLSTYTDALIWHLHWLLESGSHDAKNLREHKKAAKPNNVTKFARNRRRMAALNAALFGKGHPYSIARFGPNVLQPIRNADLRAFRKRHYHLNGATLIVTGQFDAKQVTRQIHRLYGRWPANGIVPPRAVIPQPPERKRAAHFILPEKSGSQVRVAIAFTTRSGYGRQHAARLVLGEVLRQRVGRLRSLLGSTYGINVHQAINKGPGLLAVDGAIDSSRAVQTFKALRQAIDDIRNGKQLAAAFLRARRKVLQQILGSTVNSNSVAHELQLLTVNGLGASYYSKLASRVSKLRLPDIKKLIRNELAPNRAVIIGQGDATVVDQMFRATGITNARVIR